MGAEEFWGGRKGPVREKLSNFTEDSIAHLGNCKVIVLDTLMFEWLAGRERLASCGLRQTSECGLWGRTLKRTLRFSEVVGEALEGGEVFGGRGKGSAAAKCLASGLFGRQCFLEDAITEIAELLKSIRGGGGIFLHLLEEKIEERFGQFKRIGYVAACVVVDGLLMPWVEVLRVESVVFRKEDLRCGNDDANGLGVGWMNGPNGNRVIGIRPKKTDAFDAGTLHEKREESGEFVTLGGGGLLNK